MDFFVCGCVFKTAWVAKSLKVESGPPLEENGDLPSRECRAGGLPLPRRCLRPGRRPVAHAPPRPCHRCRACAHGWRSCTPRWRSRPVRHAGAPLPARSRDSWRWDDAGWSLLAALVVTRAVGCGNLKQTEDRSLCVVGQGFNPMPAGRLPDPCFPGSVFTFRGVWFVSTVACRAEEMMGKSGDQASVDQANLACQSTTGESRGQCPPPTCK